jgi:hypothetical protein
MEIEGSLQCPQKPQLNSLLSQLIVVQTLNNIFPSDPF